MAKIKLTKTAVETAQPQAKAVELRDTVVPGFLCKITPAGRRVFMLQYRTNAGERRKPALGQFGELTVEQARLMAQSWLAEVRQGGDPGGAKAEARKAPTMEALCAKFMQDYSRKRNKPSTQEGYQSVIDRNIVPLLGRKKAHEVKRPDIAGLMEKLSYKPADANHTFGVLRKMFNMAEVWGYRPDGSNPCRHVPMYPAGKVTRLINDDEMARIFHQLKDIETEGLEYYAIPLAIRLQFEFAARMSEICALEWDWIDWENRRIVWPDSKTGGISKPISEEAYRLAAQLVRDYGRGFADKNLRRMVQFAVTFPEERIVVTLSRQLSWSHFVALLPLKAPLQREYYAQMACVERWSVRTLRERIDSMLYERTALSKKPDEMIAQELANLRDAQRMSPALVMRDPYILDFLGLRDTWQESDLEAAIIREMESFLLELGVGFTFVARQKRIQIDDEDFHLDLLFYNRKLRRLVAVELKVGEFKAAYKGQMELYLRWLDKHEREPDEASPLGIILCTGKKSEQIELLELDKSGIHVAEYLTTLPPRAVLAKRLQQATQRAQLQIAQHKKAAE